MLIFNFYIIMQYYKFLSKDKKILKDQEQKKNTCLNFENELFIVFYWNVTSLKLFLIEGGKVLFSFCMNYILNL